MSVYLDAVLEITSRLHQLSEGGSLCWIVFPTVLHNLVSGVQIDEVKISVSYQLLCAFVLKMQFTHTQLCLYVGTIINQSINQQSN